MFVVAQAEKLRDSSIGLDGFIEMLRKSQCFFLVSPHTSQRPKKGSKKAAKKAAALLLLLLQLLLCWLFRIDRRPAAD